MPQMFQKRLTFGDGNTKFTKIKSALITMTVRNLCPYMYSHHLNDAHQGIKCRCFAKKNNPCHNPCMRINLHGSRGY